MADSSSYLRATNQPTSDVRPSKTIFLVSSPANRSGGVDRRIPGDCADGRGGYQGYHGGQSENGMGYGPGYEPLTCSDLVWVMGEVMGHEDATAVLLLWRPGCGCAEPNYPRMAHDGGTARRHSPLLDSLDSLPDMIRLKRDFCGWRRVRHGANYRSSRNVRAISLEIAS